MQRLAAAFVLAATLTLAVHAQDEKPEVNVSALFQEQAQLNQRINEIRNELQVAIVKVLPKGKQSYGDLTWSCTVGSFIGLSAMDSEKQQKIWVQVLYNPDLKGKYSTDTCLGYPAKRYKDKWVWVLVGNTELRFGLSDKALESDEILEAIVKSFDLKTIETF